MRYFALASDYDATIARDRAVSDEVVAALQRLSASGRKLILVTGRRLPDLMAVFPHSDIFDRIVAENGALLYDPASKEERLLAQAPPAEFLQRLQERGVEPLVSGRVIVATKQPHETEVLQAIRELGLELQVILNKGSVMVLPSGVDKATGLAAALDALQLSPHNVVAVGDAENDHALLGAAECGVAVANALPELKELADLVTERDEGEGVVEMIGQLLAEDLSAVTPSMRRHDILVGKRAVDGTDYRIPAYGRNLLISGASADGRSLLTTALLEYIAGRGYQFCMIVSDGGYQDLNSALVLGSAERPPRLATAVEVLAQPDNNAVVNLQGMSREDRPQFFRSLMAALRAQRGAVGRPHWIVVDEAQQLLDANQTQVDPPLQQGEHTNIIFVTGQQDQIDSQILKSVDEIIALGKHAKETLLEFASTVSCPLPESASISEDTLVAAWRWREGGQPVLVQPCVVRAGMSSVQ